MAAALTITMTIAELISDWPGARAALSRRGMACIGCVMAPFETLEEAASAYGFDPYEFLRDVTLDRTSSRRRRHSS